MLLPSPTLPRLLLSPILQPARPPAHNLQIGKLRGHTDNVRSLLLHTDGSVLLSGAADGTIKLWDLCMQRCVQVMGGGCMHVFLRVCVCVCVCAQALAQMGDPAEQGAHAAG